MLHDIQRLEGELAALKGVRSGSLVVGAAFALIGSFGLLRLANFYERAHAPTLGNTFGAQALKASEVVGARGTGEYIPISAYIKRGHEKTPRDGASPGRRVEAEVGAAELPSGLLFVLIRNSNGKLLAAERNQEKKTDAIAASTALLTQMLAEQNKTYDEFVFSI